jgi:pimeloyl-ACP methyl ester carboxylesterase
VDAPRGGRSGFPGFTGELGKLDDKTQIGATTTFRPGREYAWSRWRLGPHYPDVFPVQAFPLEATDQFMQHLRPLVSDDADVISAALDALLDKIGPAIIVTHSNGGLWGWLAGARSDKVRAIVSYEPAAVFPEGEVPPPIPLYKGTQDAGTSVTPKEFANLARIPIEVVYGDNIPEKPVPELPADGHRVQVIAAKLFVDALNKKGGEADLLLLPSAGLKGNSHFSFSNKNNVAVADLLSAFLSRYKLDAH